MSNFPLGNIGDVLEGVYHGKCGTDEYSRTLHKFVTDSGDELELRGSYDLDGKLSQFTSGTVMRIERKEDRKTASGTMKLFKVQPATDENGAPIVEVLPEPKAEPKKYNAGDFVAPEDQTPEFLAFLKSQGWSMKDDNTISNLPF